MSRSVLAMLVVFVVAASVVAQGPGNPPPTTGGNGGVQNTQINGAGPNDGTSKVLPIPGSVTYSVAGGVPNAGIIMVATIGPCDVPYACGPAAAPTIAAIDCNNFTVLADGITYANPFLKLNGSGNWSVTFTLGTGLTPPNSNISDQIAWFDPSEPIFGIRVTNRCQIYAAATLVNSQTYNTDDSPLGPVNFIGNPFSFYGVARTQFFLNPNGSLSFGAGDSAFVSSTAAFLAGPARIAGCWYDFSPNQTGGNALTLTQTRTNCGNTTIVAAWNNCNTFGAADSNTFSITLNTVGNTIQYNYGSTQFVGGDGDPNIIVGITPGGGAPNPGPIDYDVTPSFTGAPGASIYENLLTTNFDLSSCAPQITFTPSGTAYTATTTTNPISISSVSPNSGCAGTVITILGCAFQPGATVMVGPNAATGVTVVSNTKITATVPAGAGSNSITVTNPDTTTATGGTFTYTASFSGNITPLSDDGTVIYTFNPCFPGSTFTFYGVSYTQVRVEMNGRLMFGATGAGDFSQSTAELMTESPEIAVFWSDCYPGFTGVTSNITFNETATALTISYNNIPRYTTGSSTGAVTLNKVTGEISYAYGAVTAVACIVGISPGNSLYAVDPGSIDLSTTTLFTASSATNPIYENLTTTDVGGLSFGFTPFGLGTGPYTYHRP